MRLLGTGFTGLYLLGMLLMPGLAEAEGRAQRVVSPARTTSLQKFVQKTKLPVGWAHFLGNRRVSGVSWERGRQLGLHGQRRQIVQINNNVLNKYIAATKGYLEVLVPAGKGHVFFRYGNKVFDFYPGGFRVGGVRPIGNSLRYGMLVKLDKQQQRTLEQYLQRLETQNGRELGQYSFFSSEGGYHCVSWMMRLGFGKEGKNLVELLGGNEGDGGSMPDFAKFMLKRAEGVESVVVYQNEERKPSQLNKMGFDLVSGAGIVRQWEATQTVD
ncbi:MAG: hypothetical protein V1754_04745 [Pseudomonadota bacterium]